MELDNQTQNPFVHTYKAPWQIYPVAWSNQPNSLNRMAIGSFIQDVNNKIAIIQFNESKNCLEKVCEINHQYPATRILFNPSANSTSDLLATSGETLRIFSVEPTTSPSQNNNQSYTLKKKFELSTKTSEYCAPLTSMDWNVVDPSIIGTASIDTTCTIWDINKQVLKNKNFQQKTKIFSISNNFTLKTKKIRFHAHN